jgi:hypothetical protein
MLTTSIVAATDGTPDELVVGVAGKRIVVRDFVIVAGAVACTVLWQSASNNMSGIMTLLANQSISHSGGGFRSQGYVLECNISESLNMTMAGASGVINGHLNYELIDG